LRAAQEAIRRIKNLTHLDWRHAVHNILERKADELHPGGSKMDHRHLQLKKEGGK